MMNLCYCCVFALFLFVSSAEESEKKKVIYCPCVMVSRYNVVTEEHDTWCIPNLKAWDNLQLFYKDEGITDYVEGGFHPISLGEMYNEGRYRVVSRLGWGTFATVWVVEDTIKNNTKVAMKATAARQRHMATDEVEQFTDLNIPGHPNVISILDHFEVTGPFGLYTFTVHPLYGKDLEELKKLGKLGMREAKIVAKQLLSALDYVHSRNIVHTDIKTNNILFKDDTLEEIVLMDFGGAVYLKDRKHFRTIQSREYRAPEIILRVPYDEKIDIWSVGCIVFEVATKNILFKPKWVKSRNKNLRHLALMSEILGPFPKDFALKGNRSLDYFTEDGELIDDVPPFLDLKTLMMEDYEMNEEDAKALSEFVLAALVVDPEKRPTAKELLKHPFVN